MSLNMLDPPVPTRLTMATHHPGTHGKDASRPACDPPLLPSQHQTPTVGEAAVLRALTPTTVLLAPTVIDALAATALPSRHRLRTVSAHPRPRTRHRLRLRLLLLANTMAVDAQGHPSFLRDGHSCLLPSRLDLVRHLHLSLTVVAGLHRWSP